MKLEDNILFAAKRIIGKQFKVLPWLFLPLFNLIKQSKGKKRGVRKNIHFESNLSIFTVSLYMYDCMYVYSILSPFPNQTFFCTPSTHNSFLPTHIDILFSWHISRKIKENFGRKKWDCRGCTVNLLICFFDNILFCLNQQSISQHFFLFLSWHQENFYIVLKFFTPELIR